MYKKLVPVKKGDHKNLKIKPSSDFSFAKSLSAIRVYVNEMDHAATFFPILFLKDPKDESFYPVALFGFSGGKNVYLDEKNRFTTAYVPLSLRAYPFSGVKTDEMTGSFIVCLDAESGRFSEDEGIPLFSENGEPTQVLVNAQKLVGEVQKGEKATREMCEHLKKMDLFTPYNVKIGTKDKQKEVGGLYTLDESKLNDMSVADYMLLREKKYLKYIYFQLASAGRIAEVILKSTR